MIPWVVKKTLLQPQHFLSTCKTQAVKIEWMHKTIPNMAKKKRKTDFLFSNRSWSNMLGAQISQHDNIQKRTQTQLPIANEIFYRYHVDIVNLAWPDLLHAAVFSFFHRGAAVKIFSKRKRNVEVSAKRLQIVLNLIFSEMIPRIKFSANKAVILFSFIMVYVMNNSES